MKAQSPPFINFDFRKVCKSLRKKGLLLSCVWSSIESAMSRVAHHKPPFEWSYFSFLIWRFQAIWERKVNKSWSQSCQQLRNASVIKTKWTVGVGVVFPWTSVKSHQCCKSVWWETEKKLKLSFLDSKVLLFNLVFIWGPTWARQALWQAVVAQSSFY